MKVAIVGANSFLAQYIIEELLNSQITLVLFGLTPIKRFKDHNFVKFSFPDTVIDYSLLLGFDAIIYTAGAGIQANLNESSENIYELNAFMPIKIANYLSDNNFKGKFVTFGSYFEIGNESQEKYYSEDDISLANNNIPNQYCVSKRILTRYFNSTCKSLDYFHLILPNIYGKGENPNRLIPYLLNALASNTEIKLTNGRQIRQYIHASDVACIVKDIINQSYQSGIYNITSEQSYSIKSVVSMVFKLTDRLSEFDEAIFGHNERSDTQMPYLLLDNQKAKNTFRVQPKIAIEEGIKTYYE